MEPELFIYWPENQGQCVCVRCAQKRAPVCVCVCVCVCVSAGAAKKVPRPGVPRRAADRERIKLDTWDAARVARCVCT